MVQLISKKKAGELLINYIDMLTKTGYVKASVVKKLFIYTFLLDFVEYMHAFIDERDYKVIESLLSKLFAGGNCLLPYPVFCVRRATLGNADYMGEFIVRTTEVNEDGRITEDERIRTANHGDF